MSRRTDDATLAGGPWQAARGDALDAAALEAVLSGSCALLAVSGFLDAARCQALALRFREYESAGKLAAHEDAMGKFLLLGALCQDVGGPADPYFQSAPKDSASRRAFYEGGEDPFLKLREALPALLGAARVEAREGKAPYHEDLLGAICVGSGVPLHVESGAQPGGLFIDKFPRRLRCGVVLQAPEEGGELRVHRRRYSPGDEEQAEAKAAPAAAYRPRTGDLYIFDPGCYYEIAPVAGRAAWIDGLTVAGLDAKRKKVTFWA